MYCLVTYRQAVSSGRKLGSTFLTPASQYVTPGFVSHALKKPVLASAMTFFGLIGSLGHKNPLGLAAGNVQVLN